MASFTFLFFNEREASTVESITSRIFPGDVDSPGAREAGVVDYIDRALAGHYKDLQPLYKGGLERLDAHCRRQFNSGFSDLTDSEQDRVLASLDVAAESRRSIADDASGEEKLLPEVTDELLTQFFVVICEHTIQGMFGDPAYSGNRRAVGWKLIGFPGTQWGYTAEQMQPGFDSRLIPVMSLEDLRKQYGKQGSE